MKSYKIRNFVKILGFLAAFFICFNIANFVLVQKDISLETYYSLNAFYEEPENSIDIVFIGPSTTIFGIDPIRLYEDYGFSSYNLGTSSQPLLVSYYWLKEAYRYQSNSLTTVVLDPTIINKSFVDYFNWSRQPIDYMKLSPNKIEAIKSYVKYGYNDDWFNYLFPITCYHERVFNLNKDDFDYKFLSTYNYRGYHYCGDKYADSSKVGEFPLRFLDEKAEAHSLDDRDLYYLNEIISFCNENELRLILFKPVSNEWNSSYFNAIKDLADKENIDYYDLNFQTEYTNTPISFLFDSVDCLHMNYWGAKKTTDAIGNILSSYNCADVRGVESYNQILLESRRTHYSEKGILDNQNSVDKYIKHAIDIPNSFILLSVCDEGSLKLTGDQRQLIAECGLMELSQLGFQESYLAVIKDGVIQIERRDTKDSIIPLQYSCMLGKKQLSLYSSGHASGGYAGIYLNGVPFLKYSQGINIAVYNYVDDILIDSRVFNTYASSVDGCISFDEYESIMSQQISVADMKSDVKKIYTYEREYENYLKNQYFEVYCGETRLFDYLYLWMQEDYVLFFSVKEDASLGCNQSIRESLIELGLEVLGNISFRESYIGIVDDGVVFYEYRDSGSEPVSYNGLIFNLISGARNAGNITSVIIRNKEYSPNDVGLNIVVYDKKIDSVVSSYCFDTCSNTMETGVLDTTKEYFPK